jgi:hypothetical protein
MKNIPRTIDETTMKAVCKFTGYTDQQYTQMVYDNALTYLTAFMPEYPAVHKEITQSVIFWNWWKEHWERRDKEFVEQMTENYHSAADCIEYHKAIHDPVALASGLFLNGQVLQETYAKMIGDIMNNQTKHSYAECNG